VLRLLHTADVHLGREFPFLRERGREHRSQLLGTFEKIVDLAVSERVSLLLIAGDLFDTNRVYGNVIRVVASAFKKLEDKGIPVCILPGTHDVYSEDSIYHSLRFPSNVTVFTPELDMKTYSEMDLTVYGKASDGKLTGESPIHGLSLTKESNFHVGLAHCSIKIEGLVEKDTMILDRNEIANSGFDYLALGHWHSFRDYSQGNTKAFYCGSPEPIDMDQKGAGSVAVVTIHEKGNVTIEPIRVGTKRIDTITIDVSSTESDERIAETIEAKADPNLILNVTLSGLCSLDYTPDSKKIEEELGRQFFCLRVLDKSHPKLDEVSSANIPEETVAGRFVKIMQDRIASASNEEDKKIYEESLKLGFALLQGRPEVIE